ncbi:MAG: 3D domain-containing protein [Candidatus Yanofskybacteria bacterium]|nr:3D domain-containing protein [Candidatus Yanofskybacteria bacterium]
MKKSLKLNSIWTILTLVTILSGTGSSIAQAAVFDWISGSTGKTSGGLAFSLLSSYLNRSTSADAEDENDQNPDDTSAAQNLSATNIASVVVNELVVAATAYSSTPDQTDDTPFITAWNTTVRDGIIATNFLPFGTKIMIPEIYGNKIFVVEDRMNRRYWHTVDIWFPDRASALEFGFKKVKIQILES